MASVQSADEYLRKHRRNESLTHLDISSNHLQQETTNRLCNVIKTNPGIDHPMHLS